MKRSEKCGKYGGQHPYNIPKKCQKVKQVKDFSGGSCVTFKQKKNI